MLTEIVTAQSAFEGFYGQVSSGYEENIFSQITPSWNNVTSPSSYSVSGFAPNKTTSGIPIVFGVGYLQRVVDSFLIGVGVDYSPLSQQTSNFSQSSTNSFGQTGIYDNMSYKVSNRLNVILLQAMRLVKKS